MRRAEAQWFRGVQRALEGRLRGCWWAVGSRDGRLGPSAAFSGGLATSRRSAGRKRINQRRPSHRPSALVDDLFPICFQSTRCCSESRPYSHPTTFTPKARPISRPSQAARRHASLPNKFNYFWPSTAHRRCSSLTGPKPTPITTIRAHPPWCLRASVVFASEAGVHMHRTLRCHYPARIQLAASKQPSYASVVDRERERF